jgi:polysaccharide biosynthesis protein PslH
VRVLFITEQFPWPLTDGGNLRTWHILQGLCRDHEVTLLSHAPAENPGYPPCAVHEPCQIVTVSKPGIDKLLWNNVRGLGLGRWPLFLIKNWSESLLARADTLLTQNSFDAIHFNHLDTAAFALAREWPQLKIFDTHNCLTSMATQVAHEWSNPVRRWAFAREARLLEQVERRVCQHMDICLVCSRNDATTFRHICPEGAYKVVPNGVDTGFFQNTSIDEPEPRAVTFTGAMNYYPNEQAALFFCREVLPLIRTAAGPLRVYLVGKDPTTSVRALHDGREIIVTGRVPDVRPFLERASVVIVPLRHGSGTRLKILEAFAMNKPVVSTRLGAEGIEAVDGREILLADNAPQFAQSVAQLLDDAALRSKMGCAARQLVESDYAWPEILRRLRTLYSGLAVEPSQEPVSIINRMDEALPSQLLPASH